MLLEKVELNPEPILKDVKTLEQKALTRHAQAVTSSRRSASMSWRCTRCVVVCEKSEVTSAEGGHDVTCHWDDACEMTSAVVKPARRLKSH